MKYPIGKYDLDKKRRKYLLYDKQTKQTSIMSAKEILNSTEDIRGFNTKGSLRGYYSNIGRIGKEQHNNSIKYYSAIQENVYLDRVTYTVVDRDAIEYELEKKQLVEMIEQGHQIAGTRIVGGVFKVTSLIDTVHKKGGVTVDDKNEIRKD